MGHVACVAGAKGGCIASVELAIESYEKAFERDPEMDSAIEGLKRLKTASEN